MKVFNIVCYSLFFICSAWSLGIYVWYRVRKHKERKEIERRSDKESEETNNEQKGQ